MSPRGLVHLCGSVPLGSVDEVLATAASALGGHAVRLPDGELGERAGWIAWQQAVLAACPQLTGREKPAGAYGRVRTTFALAEGAAPDDVDLGPLGYARAALASFARFEELRLEGAVADGTRFQVGLPSPLSMVLHFADEDDRAVLEPVFERHLRAELDEIAAAIPHERLAVQWEVVFELGVLEGTHEAWFDDEEDEIARRLAAIGGWVPPAAELGYHLCYGDSGGRHFLEPSDAGRLATVSAGVLREAPRTVDWIHMPVPIERDDDAYFAPLAGLSVPPATTLYLGLVHREDGIDGARRRIRAASTAVEAFGVAGECGLGREPAGSILPLLELHAEIADELAGGQAPGVTR